MDDNEIRVVIAERIYTEWERVTGESLDAPAGDALAVAVLDALEKSGLTIGVVVSPTDKRLRDGIASAVATELWQGYSLQADGSFFVDPLLTEIEATGFRVIENGALKQTSLPSAACEESCGQEHPWPPEYWDCLDECGRPG